MADKLIDPDMMKRLEHLMLVSRKMSSGSVKGERRSRRRGMSNDFADYRSYVAGDDLRYLDWKIYGRLERLFLKLFLEEEELTVSILIDVSQSMAHGTPQNLQYAKQVAAALGYITLSKMDRLIVCSFGDGIIEQYGPKRGKGNGARYFQWLENLETSNATGINRAVRGFTNSQRGKGLAIIISDFFDFSGYEEAFKMLMGRNYEVLAVHLLSPEELDPQHKGDLKLVDCEVGLTTDVSMGKSVMDAYGSTLDAFCGGIRDYVVRRGGTYLAASTETPFEKLVLDLLRRRGIIR
jgi:uncharacterized protein (DUF58 family)